MGKYMNKAKTSREVALMDSSLGVRTRAKTLALQQRLQKSPPPANSAGGGGAYLQLRSRRLEKQTLICDSKRQKQTPKESPESNPKCPDLVTDEGTRLETEEKKCNDADEGIEASFGENLVGFEGRERGKCICNRESTPCSLITDPDCIRTPGSTTRPTMSTEANRRLQNSMPRHIPTAKEMDEFFASAEEKQRRQFIEKYNFDPVNNAPLPGRYEWSKLDS
ncbi:cyclin-dependent kinase inhibitor 5-like isoform X2 [Rhododendron vialii]|uniref:cyclin-dependent kinase inhibitor 5-like isoform X2 n=1 Tax=Rhododendron vialii TaxID=182163 RepID=UPI00266013C6|nr:cyclin-dependent kinase inhibitor 5-like isoform X2 [Rhododendron vialii]